MLVPLAASFATSLLLFTLAYTVAHSRGVTERPFLSTYATFLSLYWMTAPLAWLYAIPVERLLSAVDATRANLGMLAIVSVWRVLLMTRVIEVLFGARRLAALWIVMLFADSVVLVVLYVTPLPIFNIMGGIPLTASEQWILATAINVGVAGAVTWLIWFVGVFIIAAGPRNWNYALDGLPRVERIRPSLWCLAAAMILVWVVILPRTQSEQRLRSEAERLFAAGQISAAIDLMSEHAQADFPPHWRPPPHLGYPDPSPPLLEVLDVIARRGAGTWVREVYIEKVRLQLDTHAYTQSDAERERLLEVLEQIPEGQPLRARVHKSAPGD